LVTRLFAKGVLRLASPPTNTLQTCKSTPERWPGKGEKYPSPNAWPTAWRPPPRLRPGLPGPRSIAPFGVVNAGAGPRKGSLDELRSACARASTTGSGRSRT